MIYVLEGMPPEWAKIYKFYSQKDPNNEVIWGIHFEQRFDNDIAYIQSKFVENPDVCSNWIGQLYNRLNFVNFSKYNLFYENLFYIPVNPTEDFKQFQEQLKSELYRFLQVRNDTYLELTADWEYRTKLPVQELFDRSKLICLLSFDEIPSTQVNTMAFNKYLYSHETGNPRQMSCFGTYVPFLSPELLPIRSHHFDNRENTIPIKIDKNGLIYFLPENTLHKGEKSYDLHLK